MTAGGFAAAVWARRQWVFVPVVLAAALTIAWLMLQTPLYRSTAKVLVENQETVYTQPQASGSIERVLLDQESIRSQVQLILAGDLVRSVIRKLDLENDPDFAGGQGLVARGLEAIGLGGDGGTPDDRVLLAFYKQLTVYQVDQSRVIAIEFSSRNPVLAARVANALAEEYLATQRSAKRDTTREASAWLDDQIDELRARVDEAERKVEAYRSENGLFSTRIGGDPASQTLPSQQLSELATQLATVRTERSSAEARARLLRNNLESGRPIEAVDVINSPLIQGLVSQAVQLRARIAELSSTLGPRHPRMLELNSQLADMRSQIRDEAAKIVRSLEAEAAVAAEREASLKAELENLKDNSAQASRQEVDLRALEREAKAQRDLLESMLARYREASTRDTLEGLPADARIISRAVPASEPYFPRAALTLAAVLLAVTLISAGAVIAAEMAQLAAMEGAVARHGPTERVDIDPAAVPVAATTAAGAAGALPAQNASLADLCAIVTGDGTDGSRLVVVRGTGEPADESAFVLSLARAVAAGGPRVVLVDTSFGQSEFETLLGAERPGLSELMMGARDFGEVLHRDPRSRVHILPAGAGFPTEDIPSETGLDLVTSALAHTYDVVLLFEPAPEAVRSVPLGKTPDAALLVVSASQPETDVGRLRDELLQEGVDAVAVVSLAPPGEEEARPMAA